MYRLRNFVALALGISLSGCSVQLPADVREAYRALPESIDYNIDVKPILSDKCFTCHGPDKAKQKAGLRLDIAENAYDELPEHPGKVAIEPGNPEESEVFKRILSDDPDYLMPSPTSHLKLSAREKAVLTKWIEEGAVYKPHWAFVKPVKPPVPARADPAWPVSNPIDLFIQSRLHKEGLAPAKEAPKEVLLRRLYLDLTGLPPTIAQTDSFLNDRSPGAYERRVDQLLASSHYGEKMAVDWLDAARYADSHGYTVDRLRDMSPYRDWVIEAFNRNLSYDQFIEQQLAGDLMPHPTRDMIIATAFNRNHPQNMEGGIVEEEFQTEYVIDRTNTFGSAFLGLTVGCAKCHDHKYDPISQKNYYELFSFFNNVREAGQISFDDALPTPTLMLPSVQKQKILDYLKTNVEAQQEKMERLRDSTATGFRQWIEQRKYATLEKDHRGLQAEFHFDHSTLDNSARPGQHGTMLRETGVKGDAPEFVGGFKGQGLKLNGDTWFDLGQAGVFERTHPFTIGIRVNIPKTLGEGVILHKCQAERLFNFRGYHLYLKNNRLELSMAHTAPSNAITKQTTDSIPRDRWIQLAITYDGSSKASGLNLYLDGRPLKMITVTDQLTKNILFPRDGSMRADKAQPGLQVGAWWRGSGFKDGKVDDIVVYDRQLAPLEIGLMTGNSSWTDIVGKPPGALDPQDLDALREYYFSACDPRIIAQADTLFKLRETLADSTENVEELMVMQEMPKPKKAHILIRGNYDAPGEEVFPNTPVAILPFPKALPRNRYGLAQWVVNENNPLTARVAVNRFWQIFFGTGIVRTSEDFGNQGEMPSYPDLLDWLATTFRESGWDVKKINKLIVMSATYRQSSAAGREDLEKDPANRLLARGPSGRMPAEMIRDNALKACGLLNERIGGKSVKPYQPDGLWEINNTSYKRDSGEAVYRRSVYVVIKRSVPNPTLSTFDAGSRSYCLMRRQSTNTPLQALVTLNDPTFVEAAKAMGEQMTALEDPGAGIVMAYRKLTGQAPDKKMTDLLLSLREHELEKFRQHPAKAAGWLNAGQHTIDKHLDVSLVAANAVVASTILNSDASLSKR